MKNLGDFLSLLEKEREIVTIDVPVDPHLEIAEIHRRVIEKEGPALLFKNVKGSSFPVVTNLFGTKKRVDLAFGKHPEIVLKELLHLATRDFPPTVKKLWRARHSLKRLLSFGMRKKSSTPVQAERAQSLNELPFLTSWPEDGGPFLTLPLVYTESPSGKPPNLGMYRIQRHDDNTTGLHFQIGKGGGFHLYEAEQRNTPLPVSIFLGGPPALILSAIAPLPENVPELLFASFVSGGKIHTSRDRETGNMIIGEAEFALLGEALPHERRDEGPFGDHYGYYSLKHPFPVFRCKKILHRKGAVYPATIVGKPKQEDFFIGDYLQELMSPLFPIVMPGIKDLWSYGETGFHSLAGAVVHERYKREVMAHAFRILGEGQLAFTKFLLLTNQSIPLRPFKPFFQLILERFRPETDLYIFPNLSLDTLDYTGPRLNEGSRGVLIGAGEKIRDLPERLDHTLPHPFEKADPFCPGCLVIEAKETKDYSLLLDNPNLQKWPLLILVDSLQETLQDETSFLWSVFTRFDPARDIHANIKQVEHHHPIYQLPLLIDARKKGYPDVVTPAKETVSLVDHRWATYF
jgi:UbiD family decarboxylase